jgi:hypothetical protein
VRSALAANFRAGDEGRNGRMGPGRLGLHAGAAAARPDSRKGNAMLDTEPVLLRYSEGPNVAQRLGNDCELCSHPIEAGQWIVSCHEPLKWVHARCGLTAAGITPGPPEPAQRLRKCRVCREPLAAGETVLRVPCWSGRSHPRCVGNVMFF